MADSLFLQRVELSNFRVYGEDFSLSLPEGPGVTLISGPNGMGKTTFFDALEWGLTGEIRRFNDYLSKRSRIEHLTRFGAPDASHRVSLYFSDGNPVDRTAAYEVSTENVASLLKTASWPEISDLYSYLSITHFLGQSSAQRFSLKKPSEQWQALRGPAGVDRLNWAKERIGSNATRMAFNRAIKEFTVELELAQSEWDEWKTLLSRRAVAKRLTSVQSRSPEEVFRAIRVINNEIAVVLRLEPAARESNSDVLMALDQTRAAIADAEAVNASKVAEFRSMEQLPSEHLSFVHEVTATANQLQQLDQASAPQARRISAEIDAVKQRDEARVRLEAELSQLRSNQTRLINLREAHEAIASSDLHLKELVTQRGVADTTVAKYQQELDGLHREEERRAALLTRKEEISSSITDAQRRLALFRQFETAKIESDQFQELHKSDLTLEELRLSLEAAQQEDLRLAEQEIEALSRVESLQTRDAAMEAAVSVILAHLQARDTECPVCMTRFEQGLIQAVQGRARTQSQELLTLTDALKKLRSDREAATAKITRLQRELAGQNLVSITRRAKEAVVSGLISELARLNVGVQAQNEVARTLQARIEELQSSLLQTDEILGSLPEPQETAGTVDATESALAISKSKLSSIRSEIDRVQSRRDGAAQSITRHNGALEERGLDPSRWSEILTGNITDTNQKAQELAQSVESLEVAKKSAESLRREREVRDNQKAILTERQKSAQFRLRGLEEKWTSAGLTFPIETASLLAAEQSADAERSSLDSLVMRVRALTDGYKAWLDDRDINNVNQLISVKKQQASVASEEEVDALLMGKVQKATERLERAASVRQLSEQLVHDLQMKADTYSQHVLRPLNTCIRQFSRALMTRADDSVTYRAEHYANRSELKPEINLRSAIGGETSIEMNPNLYFSEGQLAALSISALFAASTCFRWSRWKALLLDDPLQHSDVIHASAFVDVVANLVRELGYQVIISTHDETEFEYMTNKFRSASIPLSLCQLRVKGSIGPSRSFVHPNESDVL